MNLTDLALKPCKKALKYQDNKLVDEVVNRVTICKTSKS